MSETGPKLADHQKRQQNRLGSFQKSHCLRHPFAQIDVSWICCKQRLTVERYLNRGGDSGITEYELGEDFIWVRFNGPVKYRYGRFRPGRNHVERMKACAIAGRGLGTYISQNVRDQYEGKE
jgi:hypothetical protein